MATAVLPLDKRGLSVLCAAHIVNDLNQSAIPSILPFLIARQHLSLAAAASLILAMNLSSSIVQPLFGHWSDRRSLVWVIPASVLLACAGTATLGLWHSYGAMFAAALVAGIGVAAFHPEGSRFANYCARDERATGMSYFTLGGYGGFALGPLVVTPLLLAFGLRGTAFLIVPGAIAAAILWPELRRFEQFRPTNAGRAHAAGTDDWRSFAWLSVVTSLRSTAFFGTVTFLPLLAIHVLHASTAVGNGALTVMLLAGVGGTLAGGRLADRYDRRTIIMASVGLVVLCAGAIAIAGFRDAPIWAIFVFGAALGVSISLSASVIVVVGQELLPERIGVASGVTLGLAVSVGGIGAPIYGAIGDHAGLSVVFASIAVVALAALACALMLPPSPPRAIRMFAEAEEAAV